MPLPSRRASWSSCSVFASRVSASLAIVAARVRSRGVVARSAAISAASTLSCMSAATATRSCSAASAAAACAYEATARARVSSTLTAIERNSQPRVRITPPRMSVKDTSIPTTSQYSWANPTWMSRTIPNSSGVSAVHTICSGSGNASTAASVARFRGSQIHGSSSDAAAMPAVAIGQAARART